MIWVWLQIVRAGYKREVMNRIQPGASMSIAMPAARLLLYGIIVPLTVVVWATVWVLSRPGVILLIALCFLTLVLAAAVLSIALIISVIAISMSGLVFIIGGLGSILYLADIPQIEPPFLDIAPAGMLPTIIPHSKGVKCVLIRSNSSFHGPTTVLPSVKSPNRLSTTKSLPWEALLPCTTR